LTVSALKNSANCIFSKSKSIYCNFILLGDVLLLTFLGFGARFCKAEFLAKSAHSQLTANKPVVDCV